MPNPSDNPLRVNLPQAPSAARVGGYQPGAAARTAAAPSSPQKPSQWVAGFNEGKASIQQAEAALRKAAADLQKRADAEAKALEPQVVDLALAIAKSVLAKEVERGNYDLPAIVTGIIATVRGEPGAVTVKLNPADHASLTQTPPPANGVEMKFVADPAIPRASCAVVTGYGTIVREVDSLLAEIEQAIGKGGAQKVNA